MSIWIGRFQVDWKLTSDLDQPLAAAAVDRLVDVLLEPVLDDALHTAAHSAVRADELVAIRAVQVGPVRLTRPEDAATWAGAVGAAVAGVVAAGGPDVVRYRSRTGAVLDVLRRAALGDIRREWAWRMLGLWPASGSPQVPDVVFELLAADPPTIAPVLDAAGSALPAALDLLGPDRLARLSALAWHALGSAPVGFPVTAAADRDEAAPGAAVRLAAAGRLGAAVRTAAEAAAHAAPGAVPGSAVPGGADKRTVALAALLVASADPAAVHSGHGTAAVAALLESLTASGCSAIGEASSSAKSSADAPAPAAREDADQRSLPATEQPSRRGATTQWAGLLFCLHVLRPLLDPGAARTPAAPGMVRTDHTLIAEFGAAPVMHALGTQLCARAATAPWDDSPAADDAALLTFCGLTPDAVPPSDPQRQHEVSALADDVVAALRVRLAGRPLAELDDSRLLAAVLRRHGAVASDPGWRRVDLLLDEVSVDLRAALLDLDPGWLPILGCVVRFGYA